MLRFSRMHPDAQQLPEPQHSNLDTTTPKPAPAQQAEPQLWCASCARVVEDPLVCGDCSAVICRICGTPLESSDELAFG